ncbi:MAG: hypothetical protein KAS71_14645 [Bacteroidales bacterium]|nr:hypothetical protein [Bacteroidales bacterium]
MAKKACVWQRRDDCRDGLANLCFVRWLFPFYFEGGKQIIIQIITSAFSVIALHNRVAYAP